MLDTLVGVPNHSDLMGVWILALGSGSVAAHASPILSYFLQEFVRMRWHMEIFSRFTKEQVQNSGTPQNVRNNEISDQMGATRFSGIHWIQWILNPTVRITEV